MTSQEKAYNTQKQHPGEYSQHHGLNQSIRNERSIRILHHNQRDLPFLLPIINVSFNISFHEQNKQLDTRNRYLGDKTTLHRVYNICWLVNFRIKDAIQATFSIARLNLKNQYYYTRIRFPYTRFIWLSYLIIQDNNVIKC